MIFDDARRHWKYFVSIPSSLAGELLNNWLNCSFGLQQWRYLMKNFASWMFSLFCCFFETLDFIFSVEQSN